jgi:hypothetical protein
MLFDSKWSMSHCHIVEHGFIGSAWGGEKGEKVGREKGGRGKDGKAQPWPRPQKAQHDESPTLTLSPTPGKRNRWKRVFNCT